MAGLSADTIGFLLLAPFAVLYTRAGVVFAVTAALAVLGEAFANLALGHWVYEALPVIHQRPLVDNPVGLKQEVIRTL